MSRMAMPTSGPTGYNPGRLRPGEFVEARDSDGVWRSSAYWARKDRGIRLRAAQEACGDGSWRDGVFVVDGDESGSPWLAVLIGRHGVRSTYINWECRCGSCVLANSDYGGDYRAGVVGPDSHRL